MQDRDLAMEEWQEYGDELLEDTVPLGGGAKKRKSSASASGGRGRPSNLDKLQQIGMEASQRTKEDLKDLTTNTFVCRGPWSVAVSPDRASDHKWSGSRQRSQVVGIAPAITSGRDRASDHKWPGSRQRLTIG